MMEQKARELVLLAMDEGWTGPPFDPLALTKWRNMRAEACGDIPDARTVPAPDGELVLQYNPTRPRGRLRFSIAHEIAHSLFPDCADEIRHRDGGPTPGKDNWQLEVLCNIGAAELLMPLGSFAQLTGLELSMQSVNELRKKFDVSAEACLIRLTKLATTRCAAFCASRHEDGQYRLDYVIPAPGWKSPVTAGHAVPAGSAVTEANAIGFTAIGHERWVPNGPMMRVECMGLAPYPGGLAPRVVGLFVVDDETKLEVPQVVEVQGDVLAPRGDGAKIIAHVIPDLNIPWGGAGFASNLRHRYPAVWEQFQADAPGRNQMLELGQVFTGHIAEQITVVHMVAQHGIGKSQTQRLRYAALADCLAKVYDLAKKSGASVHMPRVGTGHGGANWDIVKELIQEVLVDRGVATTVYMLPR
ncbi:ImmA/IrrE family metallo-endopeptidase [Burkholderia sp. AW33-5]